MREIKEDPVSIPFFSEELVNTDDAVGKRVRTEYEGLTGALATLQRHYQSDINAFNGTFAYRVARILADPEVTLPPLPHWGSEVPE